MIQFGFKIIVLLGVVSTLLFFCSDNIFRGQDAYGATIKSYKKQEQIDIAIFGSSHSLNAFDPRIFEIELENNTFNLSCTSQTITTSKVIAEMAVKDHDLKHAIIDVFWMTLLFSENERGKSLQMQSLDYVPASFAKSKAVADLFEFDEIVYGFSETLRYHTKWHEKDPFSPVERYFVWNSIDSYKGYRNSNLVITEKDWNEFKKVNREREASGEPPVKLSVRQKQSILNIIEVFESKNIPMLFVNSPSYLKDYYDVDVKYNELIEEFLDELDIPYVNFHNLWDDLGLDKTYFKDPNHVNIRGAIQTSSYLASYIRDSLQINFKKRDIDFSNNRYAQLQNEFKSVLYSSKMDSIQQAGLYGITNAHLYEVSEGRLELLFIVANDTIKTQPIRLDFAMLEEERKKIPEKLFVYNNGTASAYGEFKTENVITYNGLNFIPYTFNYLSDTIAKMEFYAGHQRRIKVFTIEDLYIGNK